MRDRPERLLLYPPIISVFKYENAVSPYGVFQMVGNVAEWVADWYDEDYYKTAQDRNPKGPETGTQKAFRGGGWIDSTPSVRVSQRNGTDPKTSMNWLGFRCARDAKEGVGEQQPESKPLQTSPSDLALKRVLSPTSPAVSPARRRARTRRSADKAEGSGVG